jgi:hypothetical protein
MDMEMIFMRDGGKHGMVAWPRVIWRARQAERQLDENQLLCIISDRLHIEAVAGRNG